MISDDGNSNFDENDKDDDPVRLSATALAALNEFYEEQIQKRSLNRVDEDWELSQFWYTEETAEVLAQECVRLLAFEGNAKIACLSCPTVFKILYSKEEEIRSKIRLFEYDTRFRETFEDCFTFYDYNRPVDCLPPELRANFDVFLIDPPFLSEECLTKNAETVLFLARNRPGSKIILCTGATMESLAESLFDAKPCEFRPLHANKLSNEFYCFVNYHDVEFLNSQKMC